MSDLGEGADVRDKGGDHEDVARQRLLVLLEVGDGLRPPDVLRGQAAHQPVGQLDGLSRGLRLLLAPQLLIGRVLELRLAPGG